MGRIVEFVRYVFSSSEFQVGRAQPYTFKKVKEKTRSKEKNIFKIRNFMYQGFFDHLIN